MSATTNTRPIDTITFSTTTVNALGTTIADIVLAYINTQCASALLDCGSVGVVSVALLTESALLQAEADVKLFVRNALLDGDCTLANLTGAEIGRMIAMERNGFDAGLLPGNTARAKYLAESAWNMGEARLIVMSDGSVDWF